jgi:cell division protein FtsA
LQAPLAEAERIKTLYGTLFTAQSDAHELVSYPAAGNDTGDMLQASKAEIAEIIRPRVASILDQLRERIGQSGAEAYAGSKMVLTGGATGLPGMAEFTTAHLQRPVRLARGHGIAGLPVSFEVPAFSAVAGMALIEVSGELNGARESGDLASRVLGRVGNWLKSQF